MALEDRSTKREFTPGARVLILTKEPTQIVRDASGYEEMIGEEFLRIEEFLDTTVSCGIGRINDCKITLSNLGDRWFNKARAVPQTHQRQKEVVEYLEKVLSVSELQERNFERRREYFDLLKRGKIKKEARDISKYFDVDDNGNYKQSGYIPGTRKEDYARFEYLALDFDLMRRVWVDFKDRDGNWVPGFTGFISAVQPVYNPGQVSTLSLTCKGMMALMQRNEIVLERSVDPRYEPFRKDQIVSAQRSMLTNNLAGLRGDEIIETVLGYVRDMFSYHSGDYLTKEQSEYFYQERLWHMKDDTYRGQTLSDNYGYGPESIAAQPRRNWSERSNVMDMIGKLVIDPEIRDGEKSRYEVFQQAIRTALKLYQNKTEYAYNICKRVADLVGYDFFEDPNGNIVFQVPKYDKLPRFSGDVQIEQKDLLPTGELHALARAFNQTVSTRMPGVPAGYRPRYSDNYSNVPYHARDYILDHIALKSRRYSESEDGIVTFVEASSIANILGGFSDEVLKAELQTGYTAYSRVRDLSLEIADKLIALNRRFGVRRHSTQPMVIGGVGNAKLLDRWALLSLIKVNANIKAGTVALHHRPDIWIGKSVFLVEEQKLAYVIGTTNTFNMAAKGPHDTQVSLAFIHHPSELIGIPWQLATADETDTSVKGTEIFESMDNIDAS